MHCHITENCLMDAYVEAERTRKGFKKNVAIYLYKRL